MGTDMNALGDLPWYMNGETLYSVARWLFYAGWCAGWGVAAAFVGGRKGHAFAGFLTGVVLGPLGLLSLYCLKSRYLCAYCRQPIPREATVCRHCGRDQPADK